MSIFKCKMCGGTLEVSEGTTVCECEYCGTTQTLPKTDNEQTINMLNRASHFRQQYEFDKAMEIYEKLLESSDKDSEIYWQIVLCRYGIEYVDDPLTKKKIPTCHRTQFKSILQDADYLEALNHADSIQKDVYTKEAEYIDSIQKGILEISNKEEPFDVFICYKESDENGKRTYDSVLAQDLYYQLEREGFKVFFSRITLEGKLGTAYEPYIFAALNSSKVMVVVGTKQEYFNAVWVKNEWSRYLMLMQSDRSKTIIPAYKDMDPYDLPDALSMFQAQDMSKLGFMQDLIRGIKKLTNSEKKKETVFNTIKSDSNKIQPLLKRAYMFLEDGEWKEADNYAEKILDAEPECAEAYLIKLLVDLKLKSKTELGNPKLECSNNSYYKKALKYADNMLKKELEDYSNEKIYQAALNEYNNKNYINASEVFKKIPQYKDSEKQAKECLYECGIKRLENKMYQDAENIFKQIPDYKDAYEMAKECRDRFNADRYEFGMLRLEKKMYQDAASVFKQIPDYKDAAEKAKECLYMYAENRLNSGFFDDAENIFKQIPDYKDSKSMIEKCREKADAAVKNQKLEFALQNMESQDILEIKKAIELLDSIRDWKNAEELINECESRISDIELYERKIKEKKRRKKKILIISFAAAGIIIAGSVVYIIATIPARKYNEAMERWENGEYNYSYNLLSEIPDYKDSANAIKLLSVLSGQVTDCDEKIEILESLGDYRNAKELLLDAKYEKAYDFSRFGNYSEAVELLDSLGDYGDPNGIKQSIRKKAVGYFDDRKFSEAAEIFLILGKYEDSEEYLEKIYEQAGTYFKDKKFKYATAVYMSLGDYKNSIDKLEELYKKSLDYIDKEKYADAALILTNMKNYSDAEEKLEFLYNKALSLIGYGKYSDASSILENLKDFSNSNEKLAELNEKLDKLYNDAVKMSSNNYEEAIKLFEELDGYKDSKDKIKSLDNKIEKREEDKKNADTYEMKGTTAWVVIDNGYLNVRKSANSDAASVGKLYNGDEVTIQATSGNGKWYKVTSGDVTGYCSVEYISTSKPIPDLSESQEINDGTESSMFDLSGEWQQIGGTYFMTLTKDGDNYKAYIGYEDSDGHYNEIRFTAKPNGGNYYSYNFGFYEKRFSKTDISSYLNLPVIGDLTYSDGYLIWNCYYDDGDVFENNINIQFERN